MDRLRAENDRLMSFSMQMAELKRENDRLKQTIKNNNNNDNTHNNVHTKNIKHEIDYIIDHNVIVENEKSAVLRKSQQTVSSFLILIALAMSCLHRTSRTSQIVVPLAHIPMELRRFVFTRRGYGLKMRTSRVDRIRRRIYHRSRRR